jgi:S-DNA-T family DNA segregation ATPase FtsK/SpoIIIE
MSEAETGPTYEDAVELVLSSRSGSTSHLQRKLYIGWNQASRYIELMQAEGILSAPNSAGRREVLAPHLEPSHDR